MCEINLATIERLLITSEEVTKPSDIRSEVKNLIARTRNFIGTLDICQLSSDPKIEKYHSGKLPKKPYLVIVKVIDETKPLVLLEMLKNLTPIGVGIIYVDALEDEEVLIINTKDELSVDGNNK